jgi:amino acid transporter
MIKKITSLTLAFSGLVMLVTSIVLFLGPAGHVSHFCPWTFMGLSRHHWGVLHLNSGILFCVAMVIHTYLNWRLLVAYVKKAKSNFKTIPLAISLSLTLYVCVGGYFEIPPMGQLLGIARACRMASIETYGSPPYGSAANYPVAHIALYMGWDPEKSIAQLVRNHMSVQSPNQPLAELARANHTTIGRLLDIMQTDSTGDLNEKG